MGIHCNVILDKLLDNGIVFLTHSFLFLVISRNQSRSLLGREISVRRREDRKHLTAGQRLIKATSFQYAGKIAQVSIFLDSLPQRSFQSTVTHAFIVLIPCIGTSSEGEGGQSQP